MFHRGKFGKFYQKIYFPYIVIMRRKINESSIITLHQTKVQKNLTNHNFYGNIININ